MKGGMHERRNLLNLRRVVDEAQSPQRETITWMARMLGPERLDKVDEAIGRMKAGVPIAPPRQLPHFEEFLSNLPLKCKEVLRLRKRYLTPTKIGECMGFSARWVHGIEHEAYAMLRDRIEAGRCEPITQEVFEKHRWLFRKLGFKTFETLSVMPARPQKPTGIPDLVNLEMPVAVDLEIPVAALGLSTRARNCLRNNGLLTLRELIRLDEMELLRTKQVGRKTLREIKEALGELGLSLAMRAPYASNRAREVSEPIQKAVIEFDGTRITVGVGQQAVFWTGASPYEIKLVSVGERISMPLSEARMILSDHALALAEEKGPDNENYRILEAVSIVSATHISKSTAKILRKIARFETNIETKTAVENALQKLASK